MATRNQHRLTARNMKSVDGSFYLGHAVVDVGKRRGKVLECV